ncbi:MAG: 50S ribosomal protein L25/general stress protein Ctc [Alphaproteobacteria bacterium]|nr:50S ribosomal protein L25/general stress protein Ctc [Alphaproteobacteria bacterium]
MTSKNTALTALARAKAGKGAARATRRTGQTPGVIYGDNKEAVLISVLEKDLMKSISKQSFFTSLCDLDVAGKKFMVLPRDVQLDPVNDRPVHVDFLRVTDKTIIRVGVPVHVINQKDCPGLTKGGVLNLVSHEIEVYCRATDIPAEFTVDLAGLDVGHSIHIGTLLLQRRRLKLLLPLRLLRWVLRALRRALPLRLPRALPRLLPRVLLLRRRALLRLPLLLLKAKNNAELS